MNKFIFKKYFLKYSSNVFFRRIFYINFLNNLFKDIIKRMFLKEFI